MEIILMRLHGHQSVHLVPEQKGLRVRVNVGGVRGIPSDKTLSDDLLDWEDVLKKLNRPKVKYSKTYPWGLFFIKKE